MNKVVLVGRLARDPESRPTSSGISRTYFTVACDRRFANQQGVREADFISCVAWRQTADFVSRYFTKGKLIGLEGSISTRSYDAQDGTKKYVTEVSVDNVEFVGGRAEAGGAPVAAGSAPVAPAVPAPEAPDDIPAPAAPHAADKGFTEVIDDELPF